MRATRSRATTFAACLALTWMVAIPVTGLAASPPVANDQSGQTVEGRELALALNATDDDFDPLTFTIVDPPDHGDLDDCSFGSCTYTPDPGYTGPDSFTWTANDGTGDSNVALFSITVTPNNAPVASDQAEQVVEDRDLFVSLAVSDDDFDQLTFTIVDPPDHGDLDDCSFGSCTYTPDTGYTGPDSFMWTANDGTVDSNVATFSLTVVPNSPPIASDQADQVVEGGQLQRFLEASDGDFDPLTYAIVDPPAHGDLGDCSTGFCTYTPDPGYTGPDSFTWTAHDGTDVSNVATFNITVVPNVAPVAVDQSAFTEIDVPLPVQLSASDLENDPLTYTIVDPPDNGDLGICTAGSCTYTPDPGFRGSDTFTWSANDGLDDSNVATFSLTVDHTLRIGDVLVVETDTGTVTATFVVTLSPMASDPVTVHVETQDGTATVPGDYTFAATDLTFDPGVVSRTSLVDVLPDGLTEGDETFLAVLSDAVNATIVDGSGEATIADDDQPGAIRSTGPLTRIEISSTLNCQVDHVDDEQSEFYGSTACGTLLVVDGELFGPAFIPAGGSAQPLTAWTPVSQTQVTGTGTTADPWTIVSVVDAGLTGVRLTQTDTYVEGSESYRTQVTVAELSGAAHALRLFRAGDCYLQNSDNGFGTLSLDTGAVACRSGDETGEGTVPGVRIIQWFPLSPGSHAYEAGYSQVWSLIGQQLPFPDTCRCDEYIDNGAGLSWDIALAANGAAERSHLTTFSPLGRLPLEVDKVADAATSTTGAMNGYTITVTNPNPTGASLASIADALPVGFAYVDGSSTGVTTADPAIAGGMLTWTGPFAVGAASSVSLHFEVTVSTIEGIYLNQASADGGSDFVVPSGLTAQITVEAAANEPPLPAAGDDASGSEGVPVGLTGTATDPDLDPLTYAWSASPGLGVDPGASCSFSAPTALLTDVTCTDDGPWTVTLTADDGTNPPVGDALTLTLANADPVVAAGVDQTVADGALVSLDPATYTDPGTNDSHTCSLDWGDGTIEPGTVAPGLPGVGTCAGSHTYAGPGQYTVTVTVTDDDGDSGSDSLIVTVEAAANEPPLPAAGDDASGSEGVPVGLTGTATDPDLDPLTYAWSASPGLGVDPGASCSFSAPTALLTDVTCTDDGPWTVTLTADDGTNPPVGDALTLTLANADPVVAAGVDQTVADGALVSLDPATYTDPGTNDSHTCSLDWGDGTIEPGTVAPGLPGVGTCAGSHTYAGPGQYTVTVTVTDDDGDSGSDSLIVTVEAEPPTNEPPVATDQSASTGKDVALPIDLDATDADLDQLTYTIIDPPDHGDLDDCSSGVCTYTPDPGYTGADSFTWKANDGTADSNVATFSITIAEGGIRHFVTVPGTDLATAGFGGMRGIGTGEIELTGVSGAISAAYLYWNGPSSSNDTTANATVTFAGTPVIGTHIGFSDDNCWSFANTQSYRADVTSLVSGDGTYDLADFFDPVADINGVSLVVLFDDGNAANDRTVLIFDGNDSNVTNPFDSDGWDIHLDDIPFSAGESASLELHVADGQAAFLEAEVFLDGSPLYPAGNVFQGDTVPVGSSATATSGGLWDIRSTDITSFLSAGSNDLLLTSAFLDDCLSAVVAIVAIGNEPPANEPPVPAAGDDASGSEGVPVGLTGTATDPDLDPLTYAWSASPGLGVDPGASCSFSAPTALLTDVTCTDDGPWTVTLTADDGTNPPVGDALTLTLANADPVVAAGVDQTVADGALVSLDPATYTDPGTNDSHTCSLDWGDGTIEPGTVAPGLPGVGTCAGSHTYAGPGQYTVTVTVTDDDGDSGSDSLIVTVEAAANEPPLPAAGDDASGSEGVPVGLTGTATDPDLDPLTYAWSASPGLGVDPGASCSFSAPTALLTDVTCTDDGPWTVTLTADDGTNPPVGDALTLTLANADPVVAAGVDQTVADGALVSLDPATYTDPGTNDSHTCSLDWGDGTIEPGTVAPGLPGVGTCAGSHTYAGPGQYTVTVTVTDDDGDSGSDSLIVTVEAAANEPPVPAAGDDASGSEGVPVGLTGTATDPDLDPLTYAWSASPGLGVDPGASCSFSAPTALLTDVTCTDDGPWTVTLTADDGTNPPVGDALTLTLANADPVVVIITPTDATTVPRRATVNLSATVTDPGTNDSHTCTIDWGDGTSGQGALAAGTCTGSHAYRNAGGRTIVVRATDDDGGVGQDSATLTIDPCTHIGTPGNDNIVGTSGDDVLCGLAGNDTLIGLGGTDTLLGGPGNDRLDGGPGGDVLNGGGDADTADYSAAPAAVTVDLTAGRSTRSWGNDDLISIENATGSAFADVLIGSSGPNVLEGLVGNDTLDGRAGPDALRGGAGTDTADYSDAPGGVTVNLDGGRSADSWGDDGLSDIENVIGSSHDDRLIGSNAVNRLEGRGGDDTLDGGPASDVLLGGGGEDRVSYARAPAGVTVNLQSGSSSRTWGNDDLSTIENIFGSDFADILTGSSSRNEIFGAPGADTISGLGGNDLIHGGEGNDGIEGGSGADEILGDDGNDTVLGGDGNDTISGNDGTDRLEGQDGNDGLSGGTGPDHLLGGRGKDTLVGGPSPTQATADTLNGGDGRDTCFDGGGVQDDKPNCEILTGFVMIPPVGLLGLLAVTIGWVRSWSARMTGRARHHAPNDILAVLDRFTRLWRSRVHILRM